MKNRLRKLAVIMSLTGVMSLSVYGCGSPSEPTEAPQSEEVDLEPKANNNETESKSSDNASNESDTKTSSQTAEEEELTGEIIEISDTQFVVLKAYTEELENGALVMAAPADNDSAEADSYDKVTVAFDENTHFYTRTIRSGGADYSDAEATAKDLKKDQMVELKGSYEEEIFHASEVQLVEVIH